MNIHTITDEQIERLGKIAENAREHLSLPHGSEWALRVGLRIFGDEAAALYRELNNDRASDLENPWPPNDVLRVLAEFADDRLTRKDYDGHGHEALRVCVNRAREILSGTAKLYRELGEGGGGEE